MTAQAERVINMLRQRNLKLATAESCTGGLLAGALTAIPGSSACFEYGFITYSNEAKQALLQVPAEILQKNGAVSAETAAAMAAGTRRISGADIALSITGIAGPGGATADKPVGLVYLGYSSTAGEVTERYVFSGSRGQVRGQSVAAALAMIERLTII